MDRKWKAEYFLDDQLDLGRCIFYNCQHPLTVCQMEKVHKFCICGEPFGYIESAAALAPTKNKQVGCEENFCDYLPVARGKPTEKQPKKLKNSIKKPVTGQSQQQIFYLPNQAAYVVLDHRELYI